MSSPERIAANLLAVLLLCVVVLDRSATAAKAAITFTDGFEGTSLDPFWSPTEISGSITVPSSVQVHSGSQSGQFDTNSDFNNKYATISHQFAAPIYGHFSAWVFDTGADVVSSNNMSLQISNSVSGEYAFISATDYDFGPPTGDTYFVGGSFGPDIKTSIDRTQAWHLWSIDSTASNLTIAIDSTTVYSGAGIQFDTIFLGMYAPGFRPAYTSYWDDVSLVEAPAVPEPASLAIWGLGALGCAVAGYRRRKAA